MFGSHLSISGGMHQAIIAAEKYGMGTVQVFTKNGSIPQCRGDHEIHPAAKKRRTRNLLQR
jgi:endonuclease IV